MNNAFDRCCVLFAPDRCRHHTGLRSNSDNVHAISTRAFYRYDVESKSILCTESTSDMEFFGTPGSMTLNGRSVIGLTDDALISFAISQCKWNPFGGIKSLGIAELDLGNEQTTHNMNPIIVSSTFQRLSWKCWASAVLLL